MASKILIYVPNFGLESGGIKQYSSLLLRILKKDTDNFYYIYHDKNDPEVIGPDVLSSNQRVVTISEMHQLLLKDKSFYFKRIINYLSRIFKLNSRLFIPDALDNYCRKENIDIIHCPYQFTPDIKNVKTICTLHDVQELHFPEFFTPEERANRAVNYLKFATQASHIVVSYEHVKVDLELFFKIDKRKISTILLDMDYMWFQRFTDTTPIDVEYLQLPSRYLFYAANTWAHKNHLALIDVIARLKKEGLIVNLVCCGHQNENMVNIRDTIDELDLNGQVKFLGLVSEEVLFSLYKNTAGVVIPTLYEAGSFPLIESIYLGIPVICSNVTSLPETIGDTRFMFDPTEINDIQEKVRLLWSDEAFALAAAANASNQKRKFDNLNSLNKIKKVYSMLSNNAYSFNNNDKLQ